MPAELRNNLDRRRFLQSGSLVLTGTALGGALPAIDCAAADERQRPSLRVGLLTDCHYADRDTAGTRVYRESLAKVREAVDVFNDAKIDMAVELGDFIDAAPDAQTEIGYLNAVEDEYARLGEQRHYVLGNHCVHTLTKREFLDNCAARDAHYSFDLGERHFVVLDACYRQDGVAYGRKNFQWTDTSIPEKELAWLAADLAKNKLKTIVFVHQRLDVKGNHGVKNASDVRTVLEKSGHVAAVFQGHNHINAHQQIGGIHYCTLAAVVEGAGEKNNAYALLNLFDDGSLRIDGFRKQQAYRW